jgi:hypothetical protein
MWWIYITNFTAEDKKGEVLQIPQRLSRGLVRMVPVAKQISVLRAGYTMESLDSSVEPYTQLP